MQACQEDPATHRFRVRALKWSLLSIAGVMAALLAARIVTPATATGTLAVEAEVAQVFMVAAPVAAGAVLAWQSLWRS